MSEIKILVTPRDAMQGLKEFIPTEVKADYINCLLKVGFDTIDFGSFVSAKAIPQLRDTDEVIKMLDLTNTNTKLLAIVGNYKGALAASAFEEINYFGYPFSTSPTFLKRNINSTTDNAFATIEEMQNLCAKTNKELLIYFSMVFGNPYGDEYSDDMVIEGMERLKKIKIRNISLADTVGVGNNDLISRLYKKLSAIFPEYNFGLHLHTKHSEALSRIDIAYKAGCRQFDTAFLGMGGCPMSGEDMVGNLSTEQLLEYVETNNIGANLNKEQLILAIEKSNEVFGNTH